MEGVLVIADGTSGQLDEHTAELVSAASELSGAVTLGIVAPDPSAIADRGFPGVTRVLGMPLANDYPNHELWQQAVEGLIDMARPRAVLLPLNWDTAAFASGLAEHHDLAFVSDVVGLAIEPDGTLTTTRQMYSGKVCMSLRVSSERPALLLLRPGVWLPAESGGDAVTMELGDSAVSGDSRIRVLEVIETNDGDAGLSNADVVFAVGRGVGKAEHIKVFEEIAEQLGVALGASRPLVDVGLLPRNKQIGQSGVSVSPKLYVTFGISGALQHLEGMSKSKVIFAINTDGEAPIFDVAHWGATVDAMEVARHLLLKDENPSA